MMLLSILYLAFCYKNDVTVHFVFGILLQKLRYCPFCIWHFTRNL